MSDWSPTSNAQRTEILYDVTNAVERRVRFFQNVKKKMDICFHQGGPHRFTQIDPYKKELLNIKRRGGKIRLVTEITKNNFQYCKQLMEIVDELRHLDGVEGSMVVSEREYLAGTVMERNHPSMQIIHSNVKDVVRQAQDVFDIFRNKAIPAQQKVREFNERLVVREEFFKVITDTEEAGQILLNLAEAADREVLSIMPSARGMLRMNKIGVIDSLIKASQKGAVVKIICPLTEENSEVVKRILEYAPSISLMNGNDASCGMLISDCERFIQAELKDPFAAEFSEAIGFALYSNSKQNVNSFKTFFELIWNERMLNEELKRIEQMQKDFINIAAHQLRTPIQPITMLSELLLSKSGDIKHYSELLQIINKNGKRLRKLTEEILDVTRIESHGLELKKEILNIKDIISDVVQDYRNQIVNAQHNNIELIFYEDDKDTFVEADKGRITQVISNLVDNAVKFTYAERKEQHIGKVSISSEEKKDNRQVIISIEDTGTGIDPEILPRLFTKFASKSYQGTGLGLFISKNIIEAHGGRIWAENNNNISDGKEGATFSFSLPVYEKESKK